MNKKEKKSVGKASYAESEKKILDLVKGLIENKHHKTVTPLINKSFKKQEKESVGLEKARLYITLEEKLEQMDYLVEETKEIKHDLDFLLCEWKEKVSELKEILKRLL